MASFGHPRQQSQAQQQSQQSFMPSAMAAASQQMQMHLPMAASQPPGTFAPGTKIQVGSHRIVIQKYLSEGGFAHVYLVKLPRPVSGTDMAVLKRVAVPDKDTLRGMRTEVETMKRLKGHKPIVTYIDSHASEMQGGGYEVFLLMEFCNGGGLIDFMNTRLQHRLTEPEILKIFSDVAEGVACMHYLKPPLLHRDLKVENVLILNNPDGTKRFKVCDFGSAAPPRPAPTTIAECRQIDDDIQRHTTLQYRSPEMVDVYRKLPIDEKSDIWALGVLLYKLCYYTTPFEDQGQLAILNASLRFPAYPVFSERLRNLIAAMLRELPSNRPNIYQVLKESCRMQGIEVPIHDIYSNRPPETKPATVEPKPPVGVTISHQAPAQPVLPDIVPMRRGRPTSTASASTTPNTSIKPSPSPMRVISGDPFAALDGSKVSTPSPAPAKPAPKPMSALPPAAVLNPPDELSARFPTLDQFSLLHDQGGKFDFDSQMPSRDLNQLVTEKLADEAFALPRGSSTTPGAPKSAALPNTAKPAAAAEMSKAQAIIFNNPELQAISSAQEASAYSSSKPTVLSIGGMATEEIAASPRPQMYRYPASSETKASTGISKHLAEDVRPIGAAKTAAIPPAGHKRIPSSSRPSLESSRPQVDLLDVSPPGSGARPRPVSTHLESNMDFLREKERERASLDKGSRRSMDKSSRKSLDKSRSSQDFGEELDSLRQSEDSDSKKPKHRKRSSLSLSNTKNILSGKFGDAFKRFESHHGSSSPSNSQIPPRAPSPAKDLRDLALTPIEGSEATDGRTDDGNDPETEADMTPEMRREFERLQLAEEERRVEAAQAEYRRRLTERESGSGPMSPPASDSALPKSIGGVPRAISIQNRVQSLLSEEQRSTPVQRTAQGYGRYTDSGSPVSPQSSKPTPEVPRKPVRVMTSETQLRAQHDLTTGAPSVSTTGSSRPVVAPKPMAPAAPRKPGHLNGNPTGRAPSPTKGLAPVQQITPGGGPAEPDYLGDFSKRFPSLSTIEMVDMDLDKK
ncbi:hypothetical protein TD95_000403 [Thielaviopsis punctulata]|uniref:non-specific serine/threonine protein kinase n=1 Tax=Thielaviopsis punctulata TaxID=72032 RepID=A0A0F4Z9I8_9PEZI|nr:hypothetical protein TD95_000403 [Thielaviopsis punctulata]